MTDVPQITASEYDAILNREMHIGYGHACLWSFGDDFRMGVKGRFGSDHKLSAEHTDLARLNAHWAEFAKANG